MRHHLLLHYVDAVVKAGSIRKAAETLAITSTALNRRILAFEDELGAPIFERLPSGVRLSAAGELVIHHIRGQLADFERVRSQIADLSGERRGHVAIACSQALLPFFLPEQITAYRRAHPKVTFTILRRDRDAAEQALIDMSADLAVVYEPIRLTEMHNLLTARQPIHAVMAETHPLAARPTVRFGDCLAFPLALPSRLHGVRHILDRVAAARALTLSPAVDSDSFEFLRHHALSEGVITFQIPVGLPADGVWPPLVSRPLDPRDVPPGLLHLGHLRGRALPVAAARFAQQMQETFIARFDCV